MRTLLLLVAISGFFQNSYSQNQPKQLQAKRTVLAIKIDGVLDDGAWKDAPLATNFVEQRPNSGKIENHANRTEIFVLYDNTAIYVGGYCYEQTRDSISRELSGRDRPNVNDLVGIMLDTYNDKINAVGFYVTPYGEQFDQKYLPPDNRDISWNAVWSSASKINSDGWAFEIRIPYSALRFVSKENQTWGLNFVRTRNKRGQQFTWNAIDPKVSGFVNQAGVWTGIEKIDPPIRLSFSPYLSANVNHYKPDTKDWRTGINGGMDVKYGISESFTLDMTLVPDFGQVQSDNQVLNLSPFEVQYNENRSFFTEGTELFNKGNLFYSRRIGGTPLYYRGVSSRVNPGETILKNPRESKLLNATKISGRTKNGLGIGFFNAVTKAMYAEVEDNLTKNIRTIETNPLTNYNILVLDQSLKNNSSISFINTNVLRSGNDYDANVSAGIFNFNNKKNTYNLNGKFVVSHITKIPSKNATGLSHTLSFGKTGGRWNYQLWQEVADHNYNINDMGIMSNNNYFNHFFWSGYRWIQPKDWYQRIQININGSYRTLFKQFAGQKVDSKFRGMDFNVNGNAQFKNLWWAGAYASYISDGNDFYEPRLIGWSFKPKEKVHLNAWFESNSAKKYFSSVNYSVTFKDLFNGLTEAYILNNRYRFNDKLSLTQTVFYNPSDNEAGFYQIHSRNIVFSRRDRTTVENILSAKYNFNNRAGITFRARHYWSKVKQKQLYDLRADGELFPTIYTITPEDFNLNFFNIDALYTWQFAPGSFINIAWKDEGQLFNTDSRTGYFKNFDQIISEPQNNNLSVKIIYYLDYLDFKKWRKKNG